MEIIDKSFPSTDGAHQLVGKIYIPDTAPNAIFHLVHGMTDHIARYDSFLREMCGMGYVCVAYDNLGHGNTANDESELGYIASKKGWKFLVDDVNSVSEKMKKDYRGLPYYLMGHSMGSFIVRVAVYFYPELADKLVVMGTGGPNPASVPALAFTSAVKKCCGDKHISPTIENMAFGKYNERFGDDVPGDWLSKNPEIREKFDDDKFCNFHFSTAAMRDLVMLNTMANRRRVVGRTRKDLPIFLLSGKDDPVGDYGKGVLKVYKNFKAVGADVRMKLYSDNRHELLNDTARDEAVKDISTFLKQ